MYKDPLLVSKLLKNGKKKKKLLKNIFHKRERKKKRLNIYELNQY